MKPIIVSICVDYADLLAIAGLSWRRLAEEVYIATTPEDEATIKVCEELGFSCIKTPAIKANGDPFNKGKGLNAVHNMIAHSGSGSWILQMDADIVVPQQTIDRLHAVEPDPDKIYGAIRYMVPNPEAIGQLDPFEPRYKLLEAGKPEAGNFAARVVPGFFQLFHTSKRRTHPTQYKSAANVDIAYSRKWPTEDRITFMEQTAVYHLGPTVVNWKGRVSPRF